jgi:UDP-N-acetylmuramate dehydrogenase
MTLARKLSEDGFSGLEFAAGIPASIGGAVAMNAGAHGAEISERVLSVAAVDERGKLVELRGQEISWRYRYSGIGSNLIVTGVVLDLSPGDREVIAGLCRRNLEHRRATQPLSQPSAGSVFKNPAHDLPAGKVIEQLGLKGHKVGAAMVSELHANWIVNPIREASAQDVRGLMQLCRDRALSSAGVHLDAEIKLWGVEPLISQ